MTFENPNLSKSVRVGQLNRKFRNHSTLELLRQTLKDPQFGQVALVSSFGADSVVLLHMISVLDPATPIIFIDTELLFHQTLSYQRNLAKDLGLFDLRHITPDREAVFILDPENLMHRNDTDSCCALRKSEPLARSLSGFDGWISGRKRYQGGARIAMELFELDDQQRIKINPLAHWTREDLDGYITKNKLPRHPLVAKGYLSIGCEPCTTPSGTVEDERAGRWRGAAKTECGIHFGGIAPAGVPDIPLSIIINDDGFLLDDWAHGFSTFTKLETPAEDQPEDQPEDQKAALAIDLANDFDAIEILPWLDKINLIRIEFPVFSDGRGFSLATRLRLLGYVGRLRAKGHVLADQYTMARRAGFDEVEINQELALRQPEPQWRERSDWRACDYQRLLRQSA